jgi:hypothetical protein
VTSLQARYGRLNAQATYTLSWNKDDDSNERTFNRETALNPLDVSSEWAWSKQDCAAHRQRERSGGPARGRRLRRGPPRAGRACPTPR